jgi:NAD(P)-dependent dehydrogenase (short-subunit alcohol dehydrogenase family)
MTEPTVWELFDLTGQTALITGASGHLGRSFANALAEAGASVVVASRDRAKADLVVSELPSVKGVHQAVEIDYLDETLIESGFRAAVKSAGQIDILINNGTHPAPLDWTDVTAKEFNRVMSVATGYFLLSRLFHEHCVQRNAPGSVVMIGSMYGVVGSYPDAYADICAASPVSYHTLKGGIVHMTRHLAVYWAKDNVRVNCLSPGPFPSDKAPAEMVKRLNQKSPMQRMGQPHELKGALLLLASEAGSYLTGQNLLIDGGWTAW